MLYPLSYEGEGGTPSLASDAQLLPGRERCTRPNRKHPGRIRVALISGALALAVGGLVTVWLRSHQVVGVGAAMVSAARAGTFGPPAPDSSFNGAVDCRVDKPNAFHGADIYLCRIGETHGWNLWEWGAVVNGDLHTHATDPGLIPREPRYGWDPPW